MRRALPEPPKYGDLRTVRRFLWSPAVLRDGATGELQRRWLEWAEITERWTTWTLPVDDSWSPICWGTPPKDVEFFDGKRVLNLDRSA